jgi:serine/threonine-protein kinase RsbW
MPRNYTLSLKSVFSEVEKVPEFMDTVTKESRLADDLSSRVLLALSEAVTNAIVHGNREAPAKKVHVTLYVDQKTVKVNVRDEGDGFNPEKTPNPLKEENLLEPGGRGIFLMEEVADAISYQDHGRLISMTFYRQQKRE